MKPGDAVTVVHTGELGNVTEVQPDSRLWVETRCNRYRNWSAESFAPREGDWNQTGECLVDSDTGWCATHGRAEG